MLGLPPILTSPSTPLLIIRVSLLNSPPPLEDVTTVPKIPRLPPINKVALGDPDKVNAFRRDLGRVIVPDNLHIDDHLGFVNDQM